MIYWDTPKLKERAKDVLKGNYWQAFLVCLIFTVVTGLRLSRLVSLGDLRQYFADPAMALNALANSVTFVTGSGTLGLILRFFINRPAEVGVDRYFTLCRYGEYNTENGLFAFKCGRYIDVCITMFVRDVLILLWGLLLVIPGIVKAYEYYMVPYILAENPGISRKRAFEISKLTTSGEKGRMFLLDLSFLGWELLCVLTAGLGFLFLEPYLRATKAELYGALRFKAVREGIVTKDEIGAELFTAD